MFSICASYYMACEPAVFKKLSKKKLDHLFITTVINPFYIYHDSLAKYWINQSS